jgi:phospholipid/cholesterol/gamma-HCH transport system substrate-binding protein
VELSGQRDPNREVRITMMIERERLDSITADSYAEISSDSLIGDKYVDITSQRSAAHVPPNGEIRLKPPSNVMKSLDLPQFEAQLRSIDALLADIEAGQSPVGQLVMGTKMYTDLLSSIGHLQGAFHSAVSSTTAVGDALTTERMYDQVAGPLAAMDQKLAGMQAQLRDPTQYAAALKQLQDLRNSIAQVRAGEWMQSDQTYRDVDNMLLGFIQRVNQINADPLLNSTALYESLAGMAKQTGETMKDFRTDPRKYLRLKVF